LEQHTAELIIPGSKEPRVAVLYTPWENLKKDGSMDVGQVGFHSEKNVKKLMVDRNKEIVKRIEKTREEKDVNLKELRWERDKQIRDRKKYEDKEKVLDV
jgi:hypothetical protein